MASARRYACRVHGCDGTRKVSELCCKPHWFQLPKEVRDEIWRLFRQDPGSAAHVRACAEAVRSLRPLPPPPPPAQGALPL